MKDKQRVRETVCVVAVAVAVVAVAAAEKVSTIPIIYKNNGLFEDQFA